MANSVLKGYSQREQRHVIHQHEKNTVQKRTNPPRSPKSQKLLTSSQKKGSKPAPPFSRINYKIEKQTKKENKKLKNILKKKKNGTSSFSNLVGSTKLLEAEASEGC